MIFPKPQLKRLPIGTWRPALSTDPPGNARAWIGAILFTILWGVVYVLVRRWGLADERVHFDYIQHLVSGDWKRAGYLAMWPAYHWTVVAITLGHPTLALARLLSTGAALLGLLAFGLAWRRTYGEPAGWAVLLLATLPILQPFTAMVYTDVVALTLLLGAWAAQLHRRFIWAAGLGALACVNRQDDLVWIGFFIAWELLRGFEAERDGRRALLSRIPAIIWLALVLVSFGVFFVVMGGVLPAPIPENRPRFNIANLHCAAHLWTLLMMPIWLAQIPRAWRGAREIGRRRPRQLLAWGLGGAAAVAVLALTFTNRHPWNHPLNYWQSMQLYFLRNWPLVWMEAHPALRWLSSIAVVGSALSLGALVRAQERWREAMLAVIFGGIFLAPHFLVEPRYFIPIAVFLLFFVRLPVREARLLAVWWMGLCLAHAPCILAGQSIW